MPFEESAVSFISIVWLSSSEDFHRANELTVWRWEGSRVNGHPQEAEVVYSQLARIYWFISIKKQKVKSGQAGICPTAAPLSELHSVPSDDFTQTQQI